MRRAILCAAFAAQLSGCATWGQFDDGLRSLVGRPLDEAINVLGMPSSERTVAGRRYIQWSSWHSDVIPAISTSTTHGAVHNGRSAANYSATSLSTSYEPVDYACIITLEVDADNRVRRGQYEGNMGGCEPYIWRLKKFREPMASNKPIR